MDLSLIGKYGECVFDTFVDRLRTSSIAIRSAWLRPVDFPFSDKRDVTERFSSILSFRGGVSLLDERISPRDLLPRASAAASGGHSSSAAQGQKRTPVGWGWNLLRLGMFAPRRSISAAIQEEPDRPYWLCVEFSVPGNVDFAVCYKIPEETVTFPPPSTDPRRMTSIDAQIISAAVVVDQEVPLEDDAPAGDGAIGSDAIGEGATGSSGSGSDGEEEDQDRTVLLDFTACLRKMAGPSGDFFGRPSLDMRLAMAESLEGGRTRYILHTFLDQAIRGKRASTVVGYANGSEISVDPLEFSCSAPRQRVAPDVVSEASPK